MNLKLENSSLLFIFYLTFSLLTFRSSAQIYSKGVGIYPGNVNEDFAPVIKYGDSTYRNLALNRIAFHSGSINYNLTAQLITDGIIDSVMPEWVVSTSSQHGVLDKNESEYLVDRHRMNAIEMEGPKGWCQIEFVNRKKNVEADSAVLFGSLSVDEMEPKGWNYILQGSNDGINWNQIAKSVSDSSPGDKLPEFFYNFRPRNIRTLSIPFSITQKSAYRFFRINFEAPNVLTWNIGELALFNNNSRIEAGGPYSFTSAWMSAGRDEEWVYTDLGENCKINCIKLFWINKASKGSIQISENARDWKDLFEISDEKKLIDEFKLNQPVKARYVRVLMKNPPLSGNYILSELEVFGKGSLIYVPKGMSASSDEGLMNLSGGNWRIQRESFVKENGKELSQPGYKDNDWIAATVPGTALVSYVNTGAVPEPNFGDNQVMISESYFYSDFWYRVEFIPPVEYKGRHVYLNFDGVNWKAEVYLNGVYVGRIDGAFIRGKFDISDILIPGKNNALAVKIFKNETPGFVTEQTINSPNANGGEIGADNPTFHASVGWDWIPTVRGRNTGIYNDVFLSVSSSVTIEDPFVSADLQLPDTTFADISIELMLQNHDNNTVNGYLNVNFGSVAFKQQVSLKANETKKIFIDKNSNPSLHILNPMLWWPNGYGEPVLYDVKLSFIANNNEVSDSRSFKTGIREMEFSEEGGNLKIYVNGKRFIGRGGNWGFPESMLRYRGREYDIAVRYHKEMNFTMIRNWVGQTPDDEFFEACDRHGIMVWQDFWLANPLDGPDPKNNEMFLDNALDFVKRIRNHPSIGLYCGRNEGNPPAVLDTALRKLISTEHKGLHYISHSSRGLVSGGGAYRAMPLVYYFDKRATPKFHSEIGMPAVMNYENIQKTMPDSSLWPQNRMWGLHDFCLDGAQRGSSFNQMLEEGFGKIENVKEFAILSQWLNYQGYRAIFEAQGKYRMGAILWMSHPAWPSFVWQTYDYYFEPTGAYFGCKKGSEPLHILWNALNDSIEVVNFNSKDGYGLTASIEVLNLDGSIKFEKNMQLNCTEDNMVRCFKMEYPQGLTDVYFIRLILTKQGKIISENFYWRGLQEGNYQALRGLSKVNLVLNTKSEQKAEKRILITTISNTTSYPVIMVRLKVVKEKSGELVLPVIYSDNYISLMPGEERKIEIEVDEADLHGQKPVVELEAFNLTDRDK